MTCRSPVHEGLVICCLYLTSIPESTGSGKTYTMLGSPCGTEPGLFTLAAQDLFRIAAGHDDVLEVSALNRKREGGGGGEDIFKFI